ncbi:MAG: HAMP domain-containing histidine kinase [Planctomycetaceae bacterium]|nr:HAMP domain-containing histidine kinase [Planctomycetaceae bacterium]
MKPKIIQHQKLRTANKSQTIVTLEAPPIAPEKQFHETESHNTDIEKEYVFRALSHDIGAYLMMLEFSFHRYERLVKQWNPPLTQQTSDKQKWVSHFDSPTPAAHISWESFPSEQTLQEPIETLDEAAEHVTACLQETKKFVADLITFTKTGKINMEPECVSINILIDEILFEQKQLLDKRKIALTVSPCLPNVYVNRSRAKQLLTNLIRNAAIHGCDFHAPTIAIFPNPLQSAHIQQTRHIPLSSFFIHDNGPGIPKQYQANIFKPGYRVPGNPNEGTGVGLAVVRKIARYYQGDVLLESNPNGTTFTIILPSAD